MNELISAPATWTASMESPESEHGNLWAIVLAGGEGVRLRSLTRRLYGDDRPKQYAALVGARSLGRHVTGEGIRPVRRQRARTARP